MIAWVRSNERVLAIAGSTVIMMAGQGITGPILPLYARDFGVSTAVVGLTITTFALGRMLSNFPAGTLADRRGRRLLLIGGPLVMAVGMVGSGLAAGIADLLVWRFVAGAGSATYMTGAQLYILDVSPPERRGRNIAFNSGALLFGLAIGPAIGGVVAEIAGLRAPFLLVGVLSVGAAIYGYFRLQEPERHVFEAGEADGAGNGWTVLGSLNLLLVAGMSLAMFATRAGTRGTLVPLLAVDEYGLSEGELGAVLGMTALTGLILIGPAGQIADRIGRKATIVPTGLIATTGIILIAWAPTTAWLIVALLVLGVGTSLTGPAQYAYVADVVPDGRRGKALGIYRSAGDFGFLAAPPLLGLVADARSIDAALLVNAATLGTATVAFLVFAREVRRPTQSERSR